MLRQSDIITASAKANRGRLPHAHRLRLGLLAFAFACVACTASGTTPLTDAERAALADTLTQLQHTTSDAVDRKECATAAARFADSFTLVVDGRPGRRVDHAACEALNQNRVSSVNEIQDETVHILSRDAAFLEIRSVYTVTLTDGTVTVTPMVTTAIWSRVEGDWRLMHIHESWRDTESTVTATR